jgi:hypothetical protein
MRFSKFYYENVSRLLVEEEEEEELTEDIQRLATEEIEVLYMVVLHVVCTRVDPSSSSNPLIRYQVFNSRTASD